MCNFLADTHTALFYTCFDCTIFILDTSSFVVQRAERGVVRMTFLQHSNTSILSSWHAWTSSHESAWHWDVHRIIWPIIRGNAASRSLPSTCRKLLGSIYRKWHLSSDVISHRMGYFQNVLSVTPSRGERASTPSRSSKHQRHRGSVAPLLQGHVDPLAWLWARQCSNTWSAISSTPLEIGCQQQIMASTWWSPGLEHRSSTKEIVAFA